ncbi:hypothetical protein AK88_04315 [Plasmodium fragile]|uniref:Plasmodium RESA N-terminal domain-containing protein n=1 Tax=Plasmodium fragile TaxID=5857 RepID=A0A0D9QGE3_PLAFR|nr:uncharacterized protein AK88_04315 [Plasmodium fragile]KJP86058.1 hypothetical protein AK88_04315 [Plasmodium fragile]
MVLQDQSAVSSTRKSVYGCKRRVKKFVTSKTTPKGADKGAGKGASKDGQRRITKCITNCITTPVAPHTNQKNDSNRSNNSVKWALSKPKVIIVPLLAILYVLSLHGVFCPQKDFHHSRSLVEQNAIPVVYMPNLDISPPVTYACAPSVIEVWANSNARSGTNKKLKNALKRSVSEKNFKKRFKWTWPKISKKFVDASRGNELKEDPNQPRVLLTCHDLHSPSHMQYPLDLSSPQDVRSSPGSLAPTDHQDAYEPRATQTPYEPLATQTPYEPLATQTPYEPVDNQNTYDSRNAHDPPGAYYPSDAEIKNSIYNTMKEPQTIIDLASCKTLTPKEKIEFFFYSTSSYIYFTQEMKKRIFATGPLVTKKYMAEIFFDLCDEQKKNFLFMKETMAKISFMLADQFNLPEEKRSKCWTQVDNKLNKVMNQFDLRDRADFNHFLMQKKRHAAEDFESFIENRICLWNKITRENRYESFLELCTNLNKNSLRNKCADHDNNYQPQQSSDCYAASNPDVSNNAMNTNTRVMSHETPTASTPVTLHNTVNVASSPSQYSNVNVNSGNVNSSNVENGPVPCNSTSVATKPMPCATFSPSRPTVQPSQYKSSNANVTTSVPSNTLNANPPSTPPYTTSATVTRVPYSNFNPTICTIPQGTQTPNAAVLVDMDMERDPPRRRKRRK